ncbi:DUF3823 domain-containing protein [Chryseolinea sp. T2]|uniref:DUF3823 domain-containing protein n=1 Tax=Chryseolinea sp. T2 TaxID=3129255 RepID=UPI00307898A7
MKILNGVAIAACVMLLSACFNTDIDNYDGPNASIEGQVIDNVTGEGIQTEQPNGFRVRLIESGYVNVIPIDFWGKADGSFRNTQLFKNDYRVIPIEGPFVMPDTARITISGATEVSFTVTPFATVHASTPRVVGKNVVVDYTLTKPGSVSQKLTRSVTVVAKVPAVSNAVNDANVSHDLGGLDYAAIAATTFSDTLKNLPSGKHFVRVGTRTDNSQGKYNYSKVFEVNIP